MEKNVNNYQNQILSSLFLYFFILIIQTLRIRYNTLMLPNSNTVFEVFKTYFLATTLLFCSEYFIKFELERNFLFSKIILLLIMILFTLLVFILYPKNWIFSNKIVINIVYLVAIFTSVSISRLINNLKLRNSFTIGILYYSLFSIFFIGFSLIKPIGFIFT